MHRYHSVITYAFHILSYIHPIYYHNTLPWWTYFNLCICIFPIIQKPHPPTCAKPMMVVSPCSHNKGSQLWHWLFGPLHEPQILSRSKFLHGTYGIMHTLTWWPSLLCCLHLPICHLYIYNITPFQPPTLVLPLAIPCIDYLLASLLCFFSIVSSSSFKCKPILCPVELMLFKRATWLEVMLHLHGKCHFMHHHWILWTSSNMWASQCLHQLSCISKHPLLLLVVVEGDQEGSKLTNGHIFHQSSNSYQGGGATEKLMCTLQSLATLASQLCFWMGLPSHLAMTKRMHGCLWIRSHGVPFCNHIIDLSSSFATMNSYTLQYRPVSSIYNQIISRFLVEVHILSNLLCKHCHERTTYGHKPRERQFRVKSCWHLDFFEAPRRSWCI